MNGKTRLYVWYKFCPDYSDGLAVAVAPSKEEAIKAIERLKKIKYDRKEWGKCTTVTIKEGGSKAFCVSGGG